MLGAAEPPLRSWHESQAILQLGQRLAADISAAVPAAQAKLASATEEYFARRQQTEKLQTLLAGFMEEQRTDHARRAAAEAAELFHLCRGFREGVLDFGVSSR